MSARSAKLPTHTVQELREIVSHTWLSRGECVHSSENHWDYWELLNCLALQRSESESRNSPDAEARAYLSDWEFAQYLDIMPELSETSQELE